MKVRIFEDRIGVRYAAKDELACERLRGRNLRRIDYRHVIWSLVRNPGGFARRGLFFRAGHGIRTRDIQLGKLALYQLS